MATINDLCATALDYIGKNLTASDQHEASDAQKRSLAMALNGAQQEIHALRPSLFRTRQANALAAPKSATVDVANASKAIGIRLDAGPFLGRTIRISGDIDVNAVDATATELNLESPPGTFFKTNTSLIRAFQGTTGSPSATIYGDAIALPFGAQTVLGQIELVGYGFLSPVGDLRELAAYRSEVRSGDYGLRTSRIPLPIQPDTPTHYWVDLVSGAYGTDASFAAQPIPVLRVAPVPDRAYIVEFDLAVQPYPVDAQYIGESEYDGIYLPMPAAAIESTLLPFLLQRMTGSPWFKNEAVKPEIGRQYREARSQLINANPQADTGASFFVGCR